MSQPKEEYNRNHTLDSSMNIDMYVTCISFDSRVGQQLNGQSDLW